MSAPACTVDIPEGKIECSGLGDTSCPDGWFCHGAYCYSFPPDHDAGFDTEDAAGGLAAGGRFGAGGGGSGGSGGENPVPPILSDASVPDGSDPGKTDACVPITDCEAECGTISTCGLLLECGTCPTGTICVANQCTSSCGGCDIGGECYEIDETNPDNPCEVCSANVDPTGWSPNDGATCDDGYYCTEVDICTGGVCSGTERSCDDGIACNGKETCAESEQSCAPGETTCDPSEFCDTKTDACKITCDGGCVIDESCYEDGRLHPADPCRVCNVAASTTRWTINAGANCGQGPTACSRQDTCDAAGRCVANHRPNGARCGAGQTDCSNQDTCDGRGNCLSNNKGTNVACGTHSECERQDHCDGAGECRDEGDRAAGSLCGSGPTVCSGQDTCDGSGNCLRNDYIDFVPCGTPGPCERPDFCDGAGNCDDRGFVDPGTPCGDGEMECSGQDTCDSSGHCLPNHATSGTRCGSMPGPCQKWDECNGNGACVDHGNQDDGTVCGDPETDCSGQDTCLAGECVDNHFDSDTACGTPGPCKEQFCTGSGACADSTNVSDGTPCDDEDACTSDDACTNGTCSGSDSCEPPPDAGSPPMSDGGS